MYLFGFAVFVFAAIWIRNERRHRRRRRSLWKDPHSGLWIWIDFDGKECRSYTHPDSQSGAWHAAGSGGSGFGDGGDFGDSGADGGGGGD